MARTATDRKPVVRTTLNLPADLDGRMRDAVAARGEGAKITDFLVEAIERLVAIEEKRRSKGSGAKPDAE